jgi:hypothetical protein
MRYVDRVGMRFGKLEVIKRVPNLPHERAKFLCKCDCGNEYIAMSNALFTGNTSSCGCYRKSGDYNITHGLSHTKIFKTWNNMIQRCKDKKNKNYSGRKIKVCKRWYNIYKFIKDMGLPPSQKHSIDRINNNGNYTPSNCRWATKIEQCNNTRRNQFITFNNNTKTIAEWSKITGLSFNAIKYRIGAGWDVKKALETPSNRPI